MPSHSLRSLRVLIVDDDPLIRTTFAEQLDTQRAITVVAAASSGRQAISLLMTGQQPIDVVLLDSDMPDMDGAQTARAIYERFPKMPIVMFTVFSRDEMLTEALAEGVNGFITKDESTENVAAALLRASRGEPVMSSRPTRMLVNAYQSEQRRAVAEAKRVDAMTHPACAASRYRAASAPMQAAYRLVWTMTVGVPRISRSPSIMATTSRGSARSVSRPR